MTIEQLLAQDTTPKAMAYCFLCDDAGPHHVEVIGTELVFQCGRCFALHADPVGRSFRAAAPRHRAAA